MMIMTARLIDDDDHPDGSTSEQGRGSGKGKRADSWLETVRHHTERLRDM